MLNKVLIYTCPELRNTIHLKIDDTDVDLSSVTSKSLYKALKMVKQTPFAQKRFQDQFLDVQFDQKKKLENSNVRFWTTLFSWMKSYSRFKMIDLPQ